MKLYIKNMVCNRCKMVVENELKKSGLHPEAIELGEVMIREDLSEEQKKRLNETLLPFGFELIDDKKSRIIEQIRNLIVKSIHHSQEPITTNYSDFIARALHHDYTYLSNLFSAVEGITIEKYIILQKTEKIKELLIYDELSINEIADRLGYSTAAHLSNQFKKATGYSPLQFKKLYNKNRIPLEEV
jgi:AraC-like DNA-binding protein